MAWEGEAPAKLERAVRDGPRLRGSVALPIHVLSSSIGNLGLTSSRNIGSLTTSATNLFLRPTCSSLFELVRRPENVQNTPCCKTTAQPGRTDS